LSELNKFNLGPNL